jgi:glutamate synthase (NADPH) GltB1 subunit (EC 1.4.1.13)/glutamate synthase (NADPH) GltB3 subunit (EC 1.4.1.13)
MCGILGLYSLDGRDLPAELVLRGLDAMKERGTPHGSGVALYRPVGVPRVKAFSREPAEDGVSVPIPGGLYDLTFFGSPANVRGTVYLNSRWLDVYKVVGWPGDLDEVYGIRSLSSPAWLGHTRYPTNSPGRYPYYSHPFTAGGLRDSAQRGPELLRVQRQPTHLQDGATGASPGTTARP